MNFIKKAYGIMLFTLIFSSMSLVCSADSPSNAPYYSYEYHKNKESVAAPQGFIESQTYNYQTWGLEIPLDTPRDFIAVDDSFFILDSGNGRIVETSDKGELIKIYDHFLDKKGEKCDFTGARGLDIDKNGNFYIADYDHERVLIFGKDCVLKNLTFP